MKSTYCTYCLTAALLVWAAPLASTASSTFTIVNDTSCLSYDACGPHGGQCVGFELWFGSHCQGFGDSFAPGQSVTIDATGLVGGCYLLQRWSCGGPIMEDRGC